MISSCSSHVDTLLPCICCFVFCTVNSPFSPTHTTAWVSDNTGNVCKWANIYLERPGRKTMPAIKCPIDGCEYTTDDVEATIAAALLNSHASKHVPPVAPLATHQYRPSVRKPERPQIDIESSESQWAFFLDEWDTYKRRAGISGPDTTLELHATCSTTLHHSLFDFMGKDMLGSADEEGLLNHIKNISVKGKNNAVHRQEFYGMAQRAEQPIQAFVGQLRSKAAQCDFTTKCTSSRCSQNVSYSDAMVSDQMIVGLYDKDCQADVLARNQTLKTFNEKFHWIQAHEEGKRTQSHLNTSSILAHKSTYQQAKKRSYLPQQSGRPMDQHDNRHPQTRTSPASRSRYPGCGSQSHGLGTLLPRKENCPHWLTVCRKCKKTGHIQAVCRSSSSVTQIEDVPPESGVTSISDDISTLFSMETNHVQSGHADTTFAHMEWVNDRFVTSEDTSSMISIIHPDSETIPPIPHMEWSEGKFVLCSPKKPKRIYLNVKPLTESHSGVGLNLKLRWKNVRSGSVQCLADTGAQTCVSDTSVLNTLGISVDSLLPTRHKLISATKNQLAVNGVIMAKFENGSHSSNQLLYICDNISGLYLSEKHKSTSRWFHLHIRSATHLRKLPRFPT